MKLNAACHIEKHRWQANKNGADTTPLAVHANETFAIWIVYTGLFGRMCGPKKPKGMCWSEVTLAKGQECTSMA
ncbi:MAG TPA: hypothetical protein VM553_05210 [Dongiaceae bacterium]|nr:hypothetical protein [Dongiaceae bacterium]